MCLVHGKVSYGAGSAGLLSARQPMLASRSPPHPLSSQRGGTFIPFYFHPHFVYFILSHPNCYSISNFIPITISILLLSPSPFLSIYIVIPILYSIFISIPIPVPFKFPFQIYNLIVIWNREMISLRGPLRGSLMVPQGKP